MKRALSFLFALLLCVSLFTACQSTGGSSPAAQPQSPESSADGTAPAQEPASSDQTAPAGSLKTVQYAGYPIDNVPVTEAIRGSGGLVLPLVEEPTTLTVFESYSSPYLSGPNDVLCNQELEEKTGIHIEWQTYTEDDQWSIFLASGLYTDIIFTRVTSYRGGIDKGIEDEIYLSANDYLTDAPNFSALLRCDHSIDVQSKTDGGNYFFSCIQFGNEPAWIGPLVRTDWLEDLGLEKPVTYDDWYTMLTAFKEKKNHEGMMISNTGIDSTGFGLIAGYDTGGTFYARNGETATYGLLDEGMREYITMLQKWYSEGLIQKDFAAQNGFRDATSLYAQNSACAFEGLPVAFIPTLERTNTEEGNRVEACVLPTKTAEQQGSLHFRRVNQIVGQTCAFITTAAKERGVDRLCAQWLDYRYSEEGAFIINYGREGVSWELGDDGYPHFTDYVSANPDYSTTEMRDMCTTGNSANGLYMWNWSYDLDGETSFNGYQTWTSCSLGDWCMPDVTLTTEESEAYSAKYGDIETYVSEMLLRFIVGDLPMSEWDGFISEVRRMGIDECIGYYQAALDRYNAR